MVTVTYLSAQRNHRPSTLNFPSFQDLLKPTQKQIWGSIGIRDIIKAACCVFAPDAF